jgi:hypothetical protein
MAQSATRRAKTQRHDRRVSTSDETEVKRKPPGSEKEVLRVLIQDVMDATAFKNEASECFDVAISQFPSGLPFPDGAQRIKNTSAQLSTARNKLATAHDRLDDFLKGIVPETLKRSGWIGFIFLPARFLFRRIFGPTQPGITRRLLIVSLHRLLVSVKVLNLPILMRLWPS